MQKIIYKVLVGVMVSVGLFMSGCAGDSQQTNAAFAVLAMDNGTTGAEPYLVKDGVITLIKDINPGASGSSPYGFTAFNGKIYFSANDGTNGYGLWVTDGTEAGTTMLKVFQTTSAPTGAGDVNIKLTKEIGGIGPSGFTVFNGKLYFRANDGTHGTELWVTDGTAAGTTMLKDINPTAASGSSPSGFTVFNGKLYFRANDGVNGSELWVTDGTATGTAMLKDINPTAASGSYPSGFTVFNGKLYFNADDGVNGSELWATDGTATGTAMLKDINPTAGSGSYPSGFTAFNGKLYFSADDGVNGSELWATDGTEAGTAMVKDINLTAGSGSYPSGFTAFNGKLYFNANDGTNGYELWITDGTAAGTTMLKDIDPTAGSGSDPYNFTVYNGKLYFSADDGTNGDEPWVTDGTADGTTMLIDINPGSASSYPCSLQAFSSRGGTTYMSGNFTTLLFGAEDSTHGLEIWSSDGTAAGTKLLMDLNPGTGDGIAQIKD